jgi:murein L,D-transpeptidase YafK
MDSGIYPMTKRPLSLFVALGVAALALAGCKTETASVPSKEAKPLAPKVTALMAEKGMRKEDPILVRIYKEDSQLEVWKKRQADGRFALLKTYEICRWSGDLGPKKTEGDKQAPEGFYNVTPGQMNPRSAYYLSFDMGFPNAYDRSLGRTGKHLMVHGDCLSAGCYAMTDPQVEEVYALAREAFRGGQKSFQVQAMPFRMTAENLARRRNNPNLAFWKNLKQGSDHFEATRQEPKVAVCGKKYVFDAKASGGGFDPNAACPTFEIEPSVALAVAPKMEQDEQKYAQLVASNTELAAAYVPQNGRVRRALGEPLAPATMMAAASPAPVAPARTAPAPERSLPTMALAMADTSSVPAPISSPFVQPRAAAQVPEAVLSTPSSLNPLAWFRGSKPKELDTAATPVQTATAETPRAVTPSAQPVAPAGPVLGAEAPMTASLGAPAGSDYRSIYRQVVGLGGDRRDAAASAAERRPAASAAARPAQRPAAPRPAPSTTASAPTAAASPNLPSMNSGMMSAPILSPGTFTR